MLSLYLTEVSDLTAADVFITDMASCHIQKTSFVCNFQ